jgi:hypothetical protein
MVIKLKNLHDHIVMVTSRLYQVMTYLFPTYMYIGREIELHVIYCDIQLYICFRTPQVHIQVYPWPGFLFVILC